MVRELIRLEEVHRAFGPVKVLEGVNLRIDEGDRIGIVGHNGAGKTTLLRTISNQNQDLGDIFFAAGLRLAFLTQIRDLNENATLGEELNRRGSQFQEIEDEINQFYGNKVQVINSGKIVSKHIESILIRSKLLNSSLSNPKHEFYVSDFTDSFERSAEYFFGKHLHLKEISL